MEHPVAKDHLVRSTMRRVIVGLAALPAIGVVTVAALGLLATVTRPTLADEGNSLRPLPYVKAWADKKRNRGLVVLGVHTPEFSVEKERATVERAVRDLKIAYPVAID